MARKMFVPRSILISDRLRCRSPLAVPNRYVGANLPLLSAYPLPLFINKSRRECNDMSIGCKVHERLNRHGFGEVRTKQGLSTWRQYRNLGKRGTGLPTILIRCLFSMIAPFIKSCPKRAGQPSLHWSGLFNWACRVPRALVFVGLNRPAPVPLVMAHPFFVS